MLHPPKYRACLLGVVAVLCAATSVTPGRAAANPRETPVVRALRKARDTVVNIHSRKTVTSSETLFGNAKARKVNGMGTGIVIDPRGYIVTNHHVVDGVESLRVTLVNGGTYTASVVNFDRARDLAIIKIKPSRPLHVMPIGTSSDLMLGESVIAVGNAFGYENTVTSGIVSALSRDVDVNDKQSYKGLIQTDASINPGNSGGPLINMAGEVVGINVAIRAGAQRIGFSIPIDDARRVIARLMSIEQLDGNTHGLTTRDVKSAKRRELIVKSPGPNTPAATAGFQTGDVIVNVASKRVVDRADLERALLGRKPGEKVKVTVRRKQKTKTLTLSLTRFSGPTVVRANNVASAAVFSKAWNPLGIRLSEVRNPARVMAGSKYRGGMRVVSVRPNSPAALNGIRPGDILVGLHIWETVSAENVTYVLEHSKLRTFNPLKFYIVRGGETLFGHLNIARR
ncbi:MAG: trypsin-like peptidase domain-containing protein [Planctomycetaceae bacterium]